jgi:hypothetical protein
MYCMYVPENSLHETVDNLLAGLDQLFRRLPVDLSDGQTDVVSSNTRAVTSVCGAGTARTVPF